MEERMSELAKQRKVGKLRQFRKRLKSSRATRHVTASYFAFFSNAR